MKTKKGATKGVIGDYEFELTKIVLFCINELPFSLGIKKTIDILNGDKDAFCLKYKLYRLKTFSLLSFLSKDHIGDIIEILIDKELLQINFVSKYKNRPVLEMTEQGRKFFAKNETNLLFGTESLIDKEFPRFTNTENILFEDLSKLRKEIAQKNDLPAFIICSDNVLENICFVKPEKLKDLLKIKGISKNFVEKYGEIFIKSINIILNEQ